MRFSSETAPFRLTLACYNLFVMEAMLFSLQVLYFLHLCGIKKVFLGTPRQLFL